MQKPKNAEKEVSRSIKFSDADIKAIDRIKKIAKIRTGTEAIRQAIHRFAEHLENQLKGV